MTRSSWVVVFVAAAMLWFSTASANAQIIVAPPTTVIPYRAPAYGPYYGGGMSSIQPGSLSYLTVPSYPIYTGYSYGYPYTYNTPGFGVGYSNYRNSYYPTYSTRSSYYQAPYYKPYVSPLLYRGW